MILLDLLILYIVPNTMHKQTPLFFICPGNSIYDKYNVLYTQKLKYCGKLNAEYWFH